MHMHFPEDMPEEVRQAIEQQNMIVMSHGHEVHSFINSLNEEQLDTLRGILVNYWDRPTAAFLVGNIANIMVTKFGRCPVCGQDHDEALHEMADEGKDDNVPEDEQYKLFSGTKAEPMTETQWANFISILPQSVMEDLNEYGLTLIKQVWPMVRCKGCGIEYVSIEDRKLRVPGIDGCHGCQQKSATG